MPRYQRSDPSVIGSSKWSIRYPIPYLEHEQVKGARPNRSLFIPVAAMSAQLFYWSRETKNPGHQTIYQNRQVVDSFDWIFDEAMFSLFEVLIGVRLVPDTTSRYQTSAVYSTKKPAVFSINDTALASLMQSKPWFPIYTAMQNTAKSVDMR
jgi:hypothetical protein